MIGDWNRYNELKAQACEAQASAYATLREAASISPLGTQEDRDRSVQHYEKMTRDYLEMARKYREEIRS